MRRQEGTTTTDYPATENRSASPAGAAGAAHCAEVVSDLADR